MQIPNNKKNKKKNTNKNTKKKKKKKKTGVYLLQYPKINIAIIYYNLK